MEGATETFTKYAITLRVEGSKEFSDWVPVAILAIKCCVEFQARADQPHRGSAASTPRHPYTRAPYRVAAGAV